jgi:hypothetical protein
MTMEQKHNPKKITDALVRSQICWIIFGTVRVALRTYPFFLLNVRVLCSGCFLNKHNFTLFAYF